MSDEKNESKVLPFPTHKIKKTKPTGTNGQSSGPVRKTTFFISLVATVFMATMLTSKMNNSPSSSHGRYIASQNRELQEDILLAKKIARASLREPASRGREPTAEDLLRHGELAGLYALSFSDSGALIGIEHSGQAGSERYISDRSNFLVRNTDLLRIEFTSQKLGDSIRDQDRGMKHETYDLMRENKILARVHFTVDDSDRLYSMKVETVDESK